MILEQLATFLWKKYGVKGDPHGLMFLVADEIAKRISEQEENKKSAFSTD